MLWLPPGDQPMMLHELQGDAAPGRDIMQYGRVLAALAVGFVLATGVASADTAAD
jgi:hypothetical protein